ncbi:hypothetical protein COO60DRAFT_1522186 [Scenedesmus sp. NREL 46B-D3]|nr:hypothetical protein COO60DRAFT_1522186 [Scenedesmus sp. NREL 46B-D3]
MLECCCFFTRDTAACNLPSQCNIGPAAASMRSKSSDPSCCPPLHIRLCWWCCCGMVCLHACLMSHPPQLLSSCTSLHTCVPLLWLPAPPRALIRVEAASKHSVATAAGGALLATTTCAALTVGPALAVRGVAGLAALALALAVCRAVAARATVALVTCARHVDSALCFQKHCSTKGAIRASG